MSVYDIPSGEILRLQEQVNDLEAIIVRWKAAVMLYGTLEKKFAKAPLTKDGLRKFGKLLDKAANAMRRGSLEELEKILKEASEL